MKNKIIENKSAGNIVIELFDYLEKTKKVDRNSLEKVHREFKRMIQDLLKYNNSKNTRTAVDKTKTKTAGNYIALSNVLLGFLAKKGIIEKSNINKWKNTFISKLKGVFLDSSSHNWMMDKASGGYDWRVKKMNFGENKIIEQIGRHINPINEIKQTFKKGSESITADVFKSKYGTTVTYKITDIEEPISQGLLLQMKKELGGDFILKTNAGVDIHSSSKGVWKGITVKRLKEGYTQQDLNDDPFEFEFQPSFQKIRNAVRKDLFGITNPTKNVFDLKMKAKINREIERRWFKKHKQHINLREAKEPYPVYHPSYTSALNAAEAYAKKKGFGIDTDDWWQQISTGPRKPSKGKTNRATISLTKGGKPNNSTLALQVFNRGVDGNTYELNCYVNISNKKVK